MKINKIRLKNIHSLKGEHEIDFTKGLLAEAGLFAITGPTGSGKSTLLDAITLALYNQIPRLEKSLNRNVIEGDGGIMTRNSNDCFAEVEYTVGGKSFRSTWSISRARTGTLQQRKHEVSNAETGELIAEGVSDAPRKNEENIGLTYEQFVKAMVLSQGQFSKLLKASRDERNKLLEDITGAKDYRKIGQAVYTKWKSCEDLVKEKEAELGGINQLLLTKEDIDQIKEEQKTLVAREKESQEEFEKYKSIRDAREKLVQLKDEIKSLEQNKETHLASVKAFEDKASILEMHNRLVKHRDTINEEIAAQKEIERLRKEIDDSEGSLKTYDAKKSDFETKAKLLLNEHSEHADLIAELQSLKKKVEELNTQIKNEQLNIQVKKHELHTASNELKQLGFELTVSDDAEQVTKELTDLANNIKAIIKNAGVKDLKSLESELKTLNESKSVSSDLLRKQEELDRQLKELNDTATDLTSTEKEIMDYREALEPLNIVISELEVKAIQFQSELDRKKAMMKLEDYRAQLTKDEPCPLCGSLEHPFAHSTPAIDVDEANLSTVRTELEGKKEKRVSIQTNIQNIEKIIGLSKNKIESAKEKIAGLKDDLSTLIRSLGWDTDSTLESIQEKAKNLNDRISLLEQSRSALLANLKLEPMSQATVSWKKSDKETNLLKQSLNKHYTGNNIITDVNEIVDGLREVNINIDNLNNQKEKNEKNLSSKKKDLNEILKTLKSIVTKEKLQDIEELKASILNESTAEDYRKEKEKIDNEKITLHEQEKNLNKQLKENSEKDDATIDDDTLYECYSKSKEEADQVLKKMGVLTEKLERDQQARDVHSMGIQVLENLKKDENLWKRMNQLIGDATGKKFSNFVQDLTLEQLIIFCNIRLKELTDRYVLDVPTEDEIDKNDSLKVYDTYMGDARRSVNTLSGGETFMVSLAMAFALSDLASKNVEIESLFIDEGFGTLDPDTLDQAITILEKMQNEGDKSIGVISHVEALKERISTQIKLQKSGAGYSAIKIE